MGLAQGHNAVMSVRLEPDKIACYMFYNADIFKNKKIFSKKKNFRNTIGVMQSRRSELLQKVKRD